MKYLDKHPNCIGCPVSKYCGTMISCLRLCKSYQDNKTEMNYEEKYKEMKKRVLAIGQGYVKEVDYNSPRSIAEYIDPELRESEDERIRKGLIKGLSAMRDIHKHQTFSDDAINIDDAIAWLEKQGEKKPIEQDTEICDLWVYIREWRGKFGRLPKDEDELASCIDYVMKRQKPTEWSEKDKEILLNVKCVIDNVWHNLGLSDYDEKELQEMWEWLDKIWRRVAYPQPKQEWSEEDEKMRSAILQDLVNIKTTYPKINLQEEIDWLKSLKPNHWKPSEEQLNSLGRFIEGVYGCVDFMNIKSLYNELKQL